MTDCVRNMHNTGARLIFASKMVNNLPPHRRFQRVIPSVKIIMPLFMNGDDDGNVYYIGDDLYVHQSRYFGRCGRQDTRRFRKMTVVPMGPCTH